MAVKGKGKEIAGKAPISSSASSSGKRLAAAGSNIQRRKRRRSGVLQFFDESAVDAGCDDAESDEDGADDDLDHEFIEDEGIGPGDLKGASKAHQLPFLVKEEELSGDELEELIKDRYGRGLKYLEHEEDDKIFDDVSQTHDMKDPNIWRVKCMVGRERQITFSLMQKFIDLQNFGSKLKTISVFTLDHVKGYVYVEADKAHDVSEACKGFMNLYPSRIGTVPRNEVPQLLSVQNKSFEVVENAWVRLKNGNYKGDLAQVVAVEAGQKRATVKLVPRIDLQAMSRKFGGGISLKEAEIPSPRLINAAELEDFRPHIQVRRDRQTGEEFDVLDGLMLKDGFVYKKVSIGSLVCWGVKPSKAELLQFSEPNKDEPDDLDWVSSVYSGRKNIKVVEASNRKSDDKLRNGYDLFDLVLFGRRDFGVIIALENGSYQILKSGMGIPEVVTVKQQEIKNICVDKMFTASDRGKKTIYINDAVKVLEGPLEDKQGDVRHMYKGTLFVYDDLQTENSGLFCVKSELCEKIMELKKSSGGKKGGKSSSSFTPSAPTTLDGEEDSGNLFSRPRQKMREQTFTIGQTLRIRKGPLKGYLCRVVGVYRSDVTVKLDSLAKVLTVNENLLSVANLKRDEPAATSFDHLGAQDRKDADQELGASLWDSRVIFGSASGAGDSSRDVDCWDKSAGPSGEQNISWNKNIETSAVDANDDRWGKASVKKEGSSSNAWEKDKFPIEDAGGNWGTENFGKANESVTSDNQTSNWDQPKTTAGSVDGWGVVSDKGKAISLEQGSAWTRTAPEVCNDRNDAWDSKGKSTGRNEEDASAKVGSHGKLVDDSKGWGRSLDSPSQSKTIDSTFKDVHQSENWDKAAACKTGSAVSDVMGSWDQAKAPSGNQPENLTKAKDALKWESGGWETAGISGKGQTDGWHVSKSSDHAVDLDPLKGPSASQSDNWEKVKVPIAGESVGWEKAGGSSRIDADGLNESKSFGGQQLSSWGNPKHPSHGQSEIWGKAKIDDGDESGRWSMAGASGQVQPDGWNKPKSTFGDQASSWNNGANNHGQSGSWGKGKNVNEDESGGWRGAGASSGQVQHDGWSKPKSDSGDQISSWNNEDNKESGRNNESSWGRAKSFEGSGFGSGGGRGQNVNQGNWENKSGFNGEGGSSWSGGSGGNGEFGRGEDEGNKWSQQRDSGPSWGRGRGRGRYGGRGQRDQNDSWNGAGESEGGWRPGGGRGRGRYVGNNDDSGNGVGESGGGSGRGQNAWNNDDNWNGAGNSGGGWRSGGGRGRGRGRNAGNSDNSWNGPVESGGGFRGRGQNAGSNNDSWNGAGESGGWRSGGGSGRGRNAGNNDNSSNGVGESEGGWRSGGGRGRGRNAGNNDNSWNWTGESEGGWKSGGGRGRGRNVGNNEDIPVGRGWGRGRGRGRGSFQGSDWKNDEDRFNGNSAGSSWANKQYGGLDKSEADGKSEAGGSGSQQGRWSGGGSGGNSAGSSWANNQCGGWDKSKADGKSEAGGNGSILGRWNGGNSAGSTWGNNDQYGGGDKLKTDCRSEAAGGSSSLLGRWDGGKSAGSGWDKNQIGGSDQAKVDFKSEAAGGSNIQQGWWGGGNSFSRNNENSAGSSWGKNQIDGFDKSKADGKIEADGGSNRQQGGWDGGKSAGSSWDKNQIGSSDKSKADGKSELAGGSSSHQGGWDGGNSSNKSNFSGWNSSSQGASGGKDVSSSEAVKLSGANDPSGWNSSLQASQNQPSNWNKDKGSGEEAGKLASWNNNKGEAGKTPAADAGGSSWDKPTGKWGNSKEGDGDKGGW